jgi:dihydroorotate dehydrogenase electron transfer subunit
MKQKRTEIISNNRIAHDYHEFRFSWDKGAGAPLPGQFVTIRVSQGTSPLLRRPFALSAYDTAADIAAIIYKKIGRSTEIMAGKTAGDRIDWIGPLGNGFTLPPAGSTPVLIAGGTGLGPILFFCAYLRQNGFSPVFIFGCRSKECVPRSPLFKAENPRVATDDGSEGFKGTAVECLESLPGDLLNSGALFCCGPLPMLRACHGLAAARGVPCHVSVEQVMACGVGACMGCVVKLRDEPGYARACKDGPVFDSRKLQWT